MGVGAAVDFDSRMSTTPSRSRKIIALSAKIQDGVNVALLLSA